MKILKLSAFDAIFGNDWLKSHGPIQCEQNIKMMYYLINGSMLCLRVMELWIYTKIWNSLLFTLELVEK
jgi:hypothetical protein